MDRSLRAVLAGTFALRFSTGLTGAMLGLYLAYLPDHGGERVDAWVVGVFAAVFYVTELVLSPIFGIISDRVGHRRVMLYGPLFGGVAVVLTGLSMSLPILAGSRLLQGASTAASVPSILGFIALATAGSEAMRGKAAARFEGATLAGLGIGFIVAPKLFDAIHEQAFYLNAAVYAIALLIFWFGVSDVDREPPAPSPHVGFSRYLRLVQSAHVLLLAPTWIAVNASIGLWFSQSLFQFSKADPKYPEQILMRGYDANQITIVAIVVAIVFGVGLLYWGNRFKTMRRTTIILYGIGGGAILVLGGLIVNHAGGLIVVVPIAAAILAGAGLFVLAGATPAALGLLADVSERFPADRGAIMGLYSVFLAVGQIAGSLIGGIAAGWRGIDGMLIATFVLLGVALLPLARLRAQEHQIGGPESVTLIGELSE